MDLRCEALVHAAAACDDCCACRVLLRVLCNQVRGRCVRWMVAQVGSSCHVSVMTCQHGRLAPAFYAGRRGGIPAGRGG